MIRVLFISRPTLLTVPGGDTVQIHKTKEYLEKNYSIHIDIWNGEKVEDIRHYDLLHFFNLIRPNNLLAFLKLEIPFVVSPIYVDYSEYDRKIREGVGAKIARLFGKNGSEYLKSMMRWLRNGEYPGSLNYIIRGHKKSIKKILNSCSMILSNSNSELLRLKKDFTFSCPNEVVPNATDLNVSEIGSKREGVLCVARIEGIKNQLNLIRAIKRTDLNLIIIGKPSPNHTAYYNQCRNEANDQVSFVDHIEQDELINYYSSARVHAMVSWFETTGLSSLEAAACGANIVISDKGDQKEYFEEDAFYANPDDVEAIKEAILKAYNTSVSKKLLNRIEKEYNWNKTAEKTMEAYTAVLKNKSL